MIKRCNKVDLKKKESIQGSRGFNFWNKLELESIEEYNENGQKSHPFESFFDFLQRNVDISYILFEYLYSYIV